MFVYNTAQRTMSAHCEVALCAEFIEQWLARRAGYSETRGSIPDFPHLDAGLLEMGTGGGVAVTCGTKGRHG